LFWQCRRGVSRNHFVVALRSPASRPLPRLAP
jgi:hypothetical protein